MADLCAQVCVARRAWGHFIGMIASFGRHAPTPRVPTSHSRVLFGAQIPGPQRDSSPYSFVDDATFGIPPP